MADVKRRRTRGFLPQTTTLVHVVLCELESPYVKLGAEIAAAEKPCQRGAIRFKTESSACQELPEMPYAPENSHAFTFFGRYRRMCLEKR